MALEKIVHTEIDMVEEIAKSLAAASAAHARGRTVVHAWPTGYPAGMARLASVDVVIARS